MSEHKRSQTTKGIWISKAEQLLILDLEGADGRERADDQDFERKSALFALAIAQVVVVNMWESSVGLYNGANIALLKTVMEVNMQLFQHQKRTKLLFLIRDHASSTPISALEKTILEDMENLWTQVQQSLKNSKSTEMLDMNLKNFFEIKVFSLPHMKLMTMEFERELQILKSMFLDKKHESFLFTTEVDVPVDGLSVFLKNIWEQILKNRDLDLPTQQELLAQFRCDELAKQAINSFSLECVKVNENIGEELTKLSFNLLKVFDKQAKRYNQLVYQKKRQELIGSMMLHGQKIFTKHVQSGQKKCLGLLKNLEPKEFSIKSKELMLKATNDFEEIVNSCKMMNSDWDQGELIQRFLIEANEILEQKRTQLLMESIILSKKHVFNQTEKEILLIFQDLNASYLDQITKTKKELKLILFEKLEEIKLNFDAEIDNEPEDSLEQHVNLCISKELQEPIIRNRLREKFELCFKYENDVPKVFSKNDDIDLIYKTSRQETLTLLDNYVKLNEIQEYVSPDQQAELSSRFKLEADAMYMDAKRSVVAQQNQLPNWFIPLIVLLGWNEFVYIVSSPFVLFLFLLVMVVGYFLFQTGLNQPIFRVLSSILKDLINKFN